MDTTTEEEQLGNSSSSGNEDHSGLSNGGFAAFNRNSEPIGGGDFSPVQPRARPFSNHLRFSSVPGSPKRESKDFDFGASFSTASEMSLYQSALDLQMETRLDPRGSVYSEHVPLHTNEVLEDIAEESTIETPITLKRMMSRDSDLYFRDGIRRIDFVLAYVTEGPNAKEIHEEQRKAFEDHLIEDGLDLEYECEAEGRLVNFVKIHAPWEVLTRYAEIMKLKMPMREASESVLEELNDIFPELSQTETKDQVNIIIKEMNSMAEKAVSCFQLDKNMFPPEDKRFTYEFSREKDYLFDIPKCREDFFTPSSRSLVVDFILKRTSFSSTGQTDFSTGITKLLADGAYTASYPLHEGELFNASLNNPRGLLRKEWASLKKIHKVQPLDQVKDYLGIMFGLYFAWLGFYTYMLIPASIVGLICFLYGCFTLYSFEPSNDICDSSLNITMCPVCDSWCDYWRLDETCVHSRITYLVDNPATVVFAVFMSFWSTMFLETWKRYSATITYKWDLTGFDQGEELPRPEYLANLAHSKKKKLNVVTNMEEPYVSFWKRKLPACIMSISVVLFLIAIALAAVLGVIFYRMSVMTALALQYDKSDNGVINRHGPLITSTTAAIINLICILIFNQVYGRIAEYLTELEMPRTQTEYDDSLTLKMFLLQFVNYYASIFYIAFFKGKIIGHPGDYKRLFGYRQEECGPGGCLMELSIQLAIIMVGKQTMNTFIEMFMPKFWQFYNACQNKLADSKAYVPKTSWEKDYRLVHWDSRGLFWEYLEMVLQFGFVTIFVAAFPLAPIFALLNNAFEMRLDAQKILTYYRRPTAHRVKNIGIWYRILDSIGKLAVITNAFIIAFTSNFIPRMVWMHVASPDGSLHGFLNHSLSYFNVSDYPPQFKPREIDDPVDMCRYEDYREPPWSEDKYSYSSYHWHLLTARLAFIVVFENVVVLSTTLMRWVIPDIPHKVKEKIRREAYIINQMIVKHESMRAKREGSYATSPVYHSSSPGMDRHHLNATSNNIRRRNPNYPNPTTTTTESIV